uniref:COP9 signalosome complex subunit 3 n=1 Tax=Moina brachiata TaxID=675436 RepID=A0A4Y7NK47_9CRUS|nr:EOG090X04TU [Moina brachiata]SVE92964.1 EOG090X04TU [Moina brachiata]
MATSLEHFVTSVRNLSAEGGWRELYEFLGKSPDILMRNAEHLDHVLEILDPQLHSLGVLAVYMVKFMITNQNAVQTDVDVEGLVGKVSKFILVCNGEQIRAAPDSFAELCSQFTQYLVDKKMPARGILPLAQAIRKARMNENQLTSIHSHFLQLCLMAQNLRPALEFINLDISDINSEHGYFDAKHFLLYYYYCGTTSAALKNFELALYGFEVALTTPSSAVSHIMLESYKKYILVSLIIHGKVIPLPKYTSQLVNRLLRPMSAVYHEIASAFSTNKPASLEATLMKHKDALQRDNNWGLAKQVQQSLYKKVIQRLTQTFLTLSLSDMAMRVQLQSVADAEKLVLSMIDRGEIYASISQKDGMVLFHENPDKYDSTSTVERLQSEVDLCIELDTKIQRMEESICTNPLFVKKATGILDEEDASRNASLQTSSGPTKIPSFAM